MGEVGIEIEVGWNGIISSCISSSSEGLHSLYACNTWKRKSTALDLLLPCIFVNMNRGNKNRDNWGHGQGVRVYASTTAIQDAGTRLPPS